MEKIKSRRCLSGILLISILAAVGCGSQPQNVSDVKTDTDSSTTEVTETTELVPDLPEYDGGGRDFTILAKMEGNMSGRWTALDAYIEEQTGDIVNDAVYDRNLAIESKYNVNIKADYMAMGGEYSYTMYKEISKLVMAGDQTYDIIMPTIQDAALLARDGMLYDLATIGNVNLKNPWWSQQFNEDVNIGGRSYYADGDICMSFIRASYCVLFNKSIIEDYKIDDPYQVVLDGSWTMDNMLKMAAVYANDINGDGVFNAADNVGVGVLNNHTAVFYTASGNKFVTYDENDGFTFTGGSERSINVLENILKIYTSDDIVINFADASKRLASHAGMDQVTAAATVFEAGNLLFLAGTMNNVPSMRNMETDFGILPYPKYDEAQEKYYTYVQTWASGCAAITLSCPDSEASSIILEDMAYYSSKLITPAYYETALKTKYTRDDESQEILDMICANRTCDLGNLFNVGGLISALTNSINNKQGNFTSLIASKESNINETLEEITELYTK